jgi:3-phosphoshikimate 1-carboxyvinyltransferase
MDAMPDLADDPGGDWRPPVAPGPLHAAVRLPGSKSMTNRALVLAALAAGPTRITGPLRARDTLLMAGALRTLGAAIEEDASASDRTGGAGPAGRPEHGDGTREDRREDGGEESSARAAWLVTPGHADGRVHVDVGNAGTVLRFVPPIAALARADVEFTGDPRISHRPVGPLLTGLRELGAVIDDDERGAVPFTVRGRGGLPGGTVTVDASASSQLISGLLLAAPRFDKGLELRHDGPPAPSAPHIAMTVAMLRAAGAEVTAESRHRRSAQRGAGVPDFWRVQPGELEPREIDVEPDLSNAAPFLAAALVAGGSVTITDWPRRSLQAAGQILEVLSAMGASCILAAGGLTVTGSGTIRGLTADLRDVNELTPVLTAVAALASSPSQFTGIGHLRTHETDRLAALAAEIGALGGEVTELPDGLRIVPRPLRAGGRPFATYDDHRLVMAAAVLGLAVPGLRVAGAATVGKTFPGFPGQWAQLLESSP